MSQALPPLAPGEDLDFAVVLSPLTGDGDPIEGASSSVTVTGATLGTGAKAPAWAEDKVTLWVSGATAGVLIRIALSVVTAAARTFKKTYVIPFGEPVSLEQAKLQCRIEVDDTEEDELIAGYISAARAWVEQRTGHILVRRGFTDYFACFGDSIELLKWPVVSIGEILYEDTSGDSQEYEDGLERLNRYPARILPALNGVFPTVYASGEVSVTYVAGHLEGAAPPEAIQAMLLLIGHWYRNREISVGTMVSDVPLSAEHLADTIRLY